MRQETKTKYYIDSRAREPFIQFIRFNGITLTDLAYKLGVSKGHLSNVLAGKKALTEDLREQFAKMGITFK